GQDDVVGDRLAHDEAKLPPVLGAVGDSPVECLTRTGNVGGLAVEGDGAPVRRGDAEEGQPNIGTAGADESGESEHLASMNLEGNVFEGAVFRQPFDFETDLTGLTASAV